MKATLEFDLPKERWEHLAAVHGIDWALVVVEADRKLRLWIRGKEKPPDTAITPDAAAAMLTWLMNEIDDQGVHLGMIG